MQIDVSFDMSRKLVFNMLKNQSKLVHIIKNICLFLIIETLDETKAVMEITQTLNRTFN